MINPSHLKNSQDQAGEYIVLNTYTIGQRVIRGFILYTNNKLLQFGYLRKCLERRENFTQKNLLSS